MQSLERGAVPERLLSVVQTLLAVDSTFSVNWLGILLQAHLHPGMPQSELGKSIGIEYSATIVRLVTRLSALQVRGTGLGLIESTTNPADRRVRQISLTPQGQVVVASVMDAFMQVPAGFTAPMNSPGAEQRSSAGT